MSKIRQFIDPQDDVPVFPTTVTNAVYDQGGTSLDALLQGANASHIKYTDALSREEIAASTSLTNKVPSAAAFKSLNSDLGDIIVVERVEFDRVQTASNTYFALNKNCEKSGYTPIGIVGYSVTTTNNEKCSVYHLNINQGKTVQLYGFNWHTSTQNIGGAVLVLYKKI